jgi:hypothetical protein
LIAKVQNILKYFKQKCPDLFNSNENIDLIDKDGNLKNIRLAINQTKLASELLQPRETYILVNVVAMDVPTYFTCSPLLVDSELLTKELLGKLVPKLPKNLPKKQSRNSNS